MNGAGLYPDIAVASSLPKFTNGKEQEYTNPCPPDCEVKSENG